MKDRRLIIVMAKEIVKPNDAEDGKVMVPFYNIPATSDERWNDLTGQKRISE